MEYVELETKSCPFCAEIIQAAAVKCRFCNEFLNSERAKALLTRNNGTDAADEIADDDIIFAASPSLWAMAGSIIRAAFVLALAVFLIFYKLEQTSLFDLSESQMSTFARYRVLGGLGLGIIVILVLFIKVLNLKMTFYQVSPARVEYSRGIFDRKIDNLDMFRVMDLKLRRSLLDCIVGTGTITLTTSDKSDPEFAFLKVRNCQQLYNIIKKASLDADRKSGVVHLE